jgi:glycolate oxidase iron-sulfur subunit
MQAMLPKLQPHYGRMPEVLPAEGRRRARVGLFLGCVADALYPQTNLATAKVLQKNGCDVWVPRSQGCCGALHYHAGREEPAAEFAGQNLSAFGVESGEWNSLDAIIVNAAGCGAMLKDYGHLTHRSPSAGAGMEFALKVRDVSEFLVGLGPIEPTHPLPMRAVYHDACHLCHAQQIRKQPRQLLEMIPELDLVPLAESEICCGAAGSYNLTQPQMANRLGERKASHILETGATAVFTGNVGCLLQINRHLRHRNSTLQVAHPVDALWAAYRGDAMR